MTADGLRHDDVRVLLGAYVLGGLEAVDRDVVDRHLVGCADCSGELVRFAPVPGLLSRASWQAVVAPGSGSDVPLQPLLDQLRVRRRRSRLRLQLAGAAAVVLVTGGALASGLLTAQLRPGADGAAAPTPAEVTATERFLPAAGSRTVGHADLVAKQWGTEVTVSLDELPGAGPFLLRVVAEDARTEQAAAWSGIASGSSTVTGATSIPSGEIDDVQVLDSAGHLLASTG